MVAAEPTCVACGATAGLEQCWRGTEAENQCANDEACYDRWSALADRRVRVS